MSAITQTIEFPGAAGQAAGATALLFAIGSDTIIATAASVTERTNAKGLYQAVFGPATPGIPAGTYWFVSYDSLGNVIWEDILNSLLQATGTYQVQGAAVPVDPLANSLGGYQSGTGGGALQLLVTATIVVSSPIGPAGSLCLDHATDYNSTINRALTPNVAGVISDLTNWTIQFTAWDDDTDDVVISQAGSVLIATGSTQSVKVELTHTQLDIDPRPRAGVKPYLWKIEATSPIGGFIARLRFGTLSISKDASA